jgi:transcriptional regulator with XRE-family HTH domain
MSNKVMDLQRKVEVRLAVLGWSKAELARRLGVTNQAVGDLLGKEYPNTKSLKRLADAMGLSIQSFFEDGLPAELLQGSAPEQLPEEEDGDAA